MAIDTFMKFFVITSNHFLGLIFIATFLGVMIAILRK